MYNLERIRAGDEWKHAFSTTSGHYHYHIMATCAVFVSCVHEFRDMLQKFIIVYSDDKLIYAKFQSEHVLHKYKALRVNPGAGPRVLLEGFQERALPLRTGKGSPVGAPSVQVWTHKGDHPRRPTRAALAAWSTNQDQILREMAGWGS